MLCNNMASAVEARGMYAPSHAAQRCGVLIGWADAACASAAAVLTMAAAARYCPARHPMHCLQCHVL